MVKKQLRGAIIGYGFVSANGHIPAYLKRTQDKGDVQIIAVADICPARRSLAREALPQARIYSDYRALLDTEASKLDFVDICTPPRDHAAIAHAALVCGLHVLCEKPLTCTTEEARSLLHHASIAQRVLFPCHNYKHAPIITAIREIIRSGRIGKIGSVSLNICRSSHAKGVKDWNSDWRRENRYSGGGIAMDHGSHTFYLTFDWFESYPTAVTASMNNLEPGKYDTEDDFTATLTFPSGVAHVNLSWTAGVRKVLYVIHGENGFIRMDDDDLQIVTTNGTPPTDGAHPAVNEPVEKRSVRSYWEDASHADWFNSLFDEFCEAMDRGDFAGKEAQEALLCVHLINTAYRSAQQGSRQLAVTD
jgi:predicted dehydrogenase